MRGDPSTNWLYQIREKELKSSHQMHYPAIRHKNKALRYEPSRVQGFKHCTFCISEQSNNERISNQTNDNGTTCSSYNTSLVMTEEYLERFIISYITNTFQGYNLASFIEGLQ